ncbi:hypothetical protein ACFFK0_01985 [Paenibacillus chartarius]|uniref:DUF5325 family protein n=1 Tax=Paenibacillus chartarius TaxID=747481 RepID=A0ABV6DF04_9BACL
MNRPLALFFSIVGVLLLGGISYGFSAAGSVWIVLGFSLAAVLFVGFGFALKARLRRKQEERKDR